jgi:DNA-binding SARP family transcriptional activator
VLDISLLGERVIRNATGTIRTRSSRTLALIAFLVVHAGSPQTRQRIAALFWPDSTDDQALTNLRRELHHLRQLLGDEPSLVVTARDLCWEDTATCRVDVRAFTVDHDAAMAAQLAGDTKTALARASAAIEHYCGELLPGSYDDWTLEARAELEQRSVELLDLIGDTQSQLGDLSAAAEAARRRIQQRPLEEIGYRRLIELQGDLGDRAGAVSTYHHCASVLERELGIEPDAATRKALDRLLNSVAQDPLPPQQPTTGRAGVAAARLIGRSAEFERLQDAWQAAVGGRPGLVLVHGDAGVGKTRLVAELAELAGLSGAVVARAQCFGTAGQLALSPVADWLRAPAVRLRLTTLDPVWRNEVERLVPSGKARTEPGPSSRAMVDAWQRHRFFEGLARALLSAGRPTLLVLDNVQWCDQETLAFLTFCLGLAADAPVLVAGTVRTGEQPRGLTDWTTRMRATGMVTDVRLSPLDGTDAVQLAEAVTGRPFAIDDAELLQATTGGFPLYIVEAARNGGGHGERPLPVGDLRAVLRTRLDRVTAPAQEVAGLAAAVGRNFTLDLLLEASDLDADAVVQAIDELWRHRILREIGDGYDFSHDLLRETAYAQVSPPRQWLLHRRIAQGLELLHPDDSDAVSAQLAEQYVRGGRPDRAVSYYRRAADVAAGMLAHAEAVRLHKEALSIVRSQPDGRERRGHELALLEAMTAPLNARLGYASPELRATLERSIVLAEGLGRRHSLVTALVGLWASQFVHGDGADAHRTAARALALVEPGSELSGPAHFAFGGSSVSLGRPAEAVHHLDIAATVGGRHSLSVGTRTDVHAKAFAAHAHWLMGDAVEAVMTAGEAIALARTTDSPYNLAVALAYGAVTNQLADDAPAVSEMVGELCDLCHQYDFAYYREWALVLKGWARGDDAGLDLARRGIGNLTAQGSLARLPYWLSVVADLAQRVGRPDAAHARLDAALSAATARDDFWWLPEVMRQRAAFDNDFAAAQRLTAAAELAAAHGSAALFDRITADMSALGVPQPAFGVRPGGSAGVASPNAARTIRS